MPELPEVETIVRELAPRIVGRRVVSAEILHRRIVRHSNLELSAILPGQRIVTVRRHGKFILVQLEKDWLSLHLGMTGQLLLDAVPSRYTRAVLQLSDTTLFYDDIRMFGSMESGRERVDALGPDAMRDAGWQDRLPAHRSPIKAVLLNQSVVAGLGNIYTDEALYRARIHPQSPANRLSRARGAQLAAITRDLLEEAVASRGSSISDYVDTAGRQGSFQDRHQVYGREGKPCPRCGSPIRRVVIAQRGTHYCPLCQKR